MSNPVQEYLNKIQDRLIGLDDTFQFKCMGCGKCCKNREDILLNSRDLFNIAKKLGLTMAQALEKYCEVFIGPSSRIPVARLLPRGANRVCPFLDGTKCSVHDSKPAICAMYPLGRVVSGKNTSQGIHGGQLGMQLQYTLAPVSCGRRKHKHTVRSWLEMFNIPIDDEFYLLWTDLIATLSAIITGLEERGLSERTLEAAWHGIIGAIYIGYDTEKDFLEQFKENRTKILRLLKTLDEK